MPFPLMALVHEGSHCLGLIICGERKEEEEDGRSLSSEEEEEVASAKIAQDAPAVLELLLHREGLKDKIASLDKSAGGGFESIDRRLLSSSLSVSLGKKVGEAISDCEFCRGCVGTHTRGEREREHTHTPIRRSRREENIAPAHVIASRRR